jgi:hypothetical protein
MTHARSDAYYIAYSIITTTGIIHDVARHEESSRGILDFFSAHVPEELKTIFYSELCFWKCVCVAFSFLADGELSFWLLASERSAI